MRVSRVSNGGPSANRRPGPPWFGAPAAGKGRRRGDLAALAGRGCRAYRCGTRDGPPRGAVLLLEGSALYNLRLFGGLQLEGPGGIVVGLASRRRPLALLAVLAVAGERGVSRDRVAGLLWGDTDDKHALRSLSDALYTVRSDLSPDAVLSSATELRLNPAVIRSDVQVFAQAMARGDRAAAVDAYRGPLLDGFHVPGAQPFGEWLDAERLRFATQVAAALEHLAVEAREARDLAAAVAWWRRLAVDDPYNSRVAVELARDLAREGDPGNGLQFLRDHVELLRSGLDAEPDAEVLRLMEDLRAGAGGPLAARAKPSPEATGAARSAPEAVTGSGAASAAAEPGVPAAGASRQRAARRRTLPRSVLAGAALALVAVAIGLAYTWYVGRGEPVPVLGRAVRLTNGPGLALNPAVSPDGKWVAYIVPPIGAFGQLMVRPIAGGRVMRVPDDSVDWQDSPAWSPEGQRLLFLAGRGLGLDPHVALAPAFGGPMRVLSACDWNVVAWSPDGRQFLCVSGGMLVRQTVDGGPRDTVLRSPPEAVAFYGCAWGSAGFIACSSGNVWFRWGDEASLGNLAPSSIWIISTGDGAARALDTTTALNESPVWSGDGRHLYFVSDRSGQRDIWRYRIASDGRPVGEPVRLTTGANAMSVSVTPDERVLTWNTYVHRASSLWSAPLREGGVIDRESGRRITRGSQGIDINSSRLSPDGRWITFLSDARGNNDLYRVAASGDDVEPLTDTPENEGTGDISPDGTELVYYVRRDGSRDVFVRSLEDGGTTRVTRTPRAEERLVAWSPDGRAISALDFARGIYDTTQTQITWVIERDSAGSWGEPRVAVPDRYCPWLRAGRLLCTWGEVVLAVSIHGEPAETLYVARRREPPVRPWRTFPGGDGNSVLIVDSGGVIWRIASPRARPVRIARIADSAIVRRLFAIRGGRIFYYNPDQPASADIWVARLEVPR